MVLTKLCVIKPRFVVVFNKYKMLNDCDTPLHEAVNSFRSWFSENYKSLLLCIAPLPF